jgi:acyl-CoA reductase-like NAD-dependent aldehyde dehydrogenase
MTIDGKVVRSPTTFDVINPATEQVFAQAPECTREQLDLAVEAAARAFPAWSKDEARRRQALRDCAEVIRENTGELGEIFTREQGRVLDDTRGELGYSAWWFEQLAQMEIPVTRIFDNQTDRVEVRRKPLGVVGAIVPWNFPILIATAKIAPALLVGNTVVLKPSPFTPLTTLRLGELLREVLPPGVFNVVSGGDELGAWMTAHPGIRMVTFTGSVETGKLVAQSTAPRLARSVLELGGNDAAIVLPDVNPEQAAEKIFQAAFGQCGQVCIAIKRLYVHEDIYSEMVSELAKIARRVKLGDGMEAGTDMGPLNNRVQLEKVIELTEDARRQGAEFITGGGRLDRPGYFFPPTIVTHVAEGVRLVDEEQFGPLLPVMPFQSVDEAIERANKTDYGLGGSIWTKDLDRGAELASRLDCGTAWVNNHKSIHPEIPQGGAKSSGIGFLTGQMGLDDLCQLQVISIAK